MALETVQPPIFEYATPTPARSIFPSIRFAQGVGAGCIAVSVIQDAHSTSSFASDALFNGICISIAAALIFKATAVMRTKVLKRRLVERNAWSCIGLGVGTLAVSAAVMYLGDILQVPQLSGDLFLGCGVIASIASVWMAYADSETAEDRG